VPDPWYPDADEYYVPPDDESQYPTRQGDVFEVRSDVTPPDWAGFIVVSPSCEVQSKATDAQVARLRRVSDLPDEFQRVQVTYGFDTRDPAVVKVAFAHTFWMPPALDDGPLSGDLFANFREVISIPQVAVLPEVRARAMTHEARLYFIRRKVFYRYRWNLTIEDVRTLEEERIASDANFAGPRPLWAQLAAQEESTSTG
jgi:hypothetical protein